MAPVFRPRLVTIMTGRPVSLKVKPSVSPQGSDYDVAVMHTGNSLARLDYQWDPHTTGPGSFRFLIETNRYFPCLQGHIPDNTLWSDFEKGKENSAEYYYSCCQFLRVIIAECEQLTGSKLNLEWARQGIFWQFAARVYSRYTNLAGGQIVFDRSAYAPGETPNRVTGEAILHTFSHGGAGIVCHTDLTVVTQWRTIYKALTQEIRHDWKMSAENLVMMYEQLKGQADAIQKVLEFEVDRGTFDRGHCQLCP